ncbi:MAG: hypothetical protein KAX84_19650 [Burkholderiales bacterium]|nr:hypothetical protein [Burkholderiales bacterium]
MLPAAISRIADAVRAIAVSGGASWVAPAAASAIDMALWDLLGRLHAAIVASTWRSSQARRNTSMAASSRC